MNKFFKLLIGILFIAVPVWCVLRIDIVWTSLISFLVGGVAIFSLVLGLVLMLLALAEFKEEQKKEEETEPKSSEHEVIDVNEKWINKERKDHEDNHKQKSEEKKEKPKKKRKKRKKKVKVEEIEESSSIQSPGIIYDEATTENETKEGEQA
jgi:hypothetical protein